MSLTIFEVFLITHLLMEWIFQTDWEAKNKKQNFLPLFRHSLTYTIGFAIVFWFYEINLLWLILIFVSHFILDKRDFEYWILEKIKGVKKEECPDYLFEIILIGVDQTLHLLVLGIICLLM